jgi:hypothetical protein
MNSRMIGDFRVRCAVVQEGTKPVFQLRVWTRRVGGNAPEKCWSVPGQAPLRSLDEAEQACQQVFLAICGVRFNGEPEFAHAPASGAAIVQAAMIKLTTKKSHYQ